MRPATLVRRAAVSVALLATLAVVSAAHAQSPALREYDRAERLALVEDDRPAAMRILNALIGQSGQERAVLAKAHLLVGALRYFNEDLPGARQSFEAALAIDAATSLPPGRFNPAVIGFFNGVKSARPSAPVVPAAQQRQTAPGFDLGDLEAGSRRIGEMEGAFAKVEGYEKGDTAAEFKAAAWGKFLDAYAADVTGTRMDDLMRETARERKGRWETAARERQEELSREEARRREAEAQRQEAVRRAASAPATGQVWREPSTGIDMVWVPGGEFDMGSNDGDSDEKPVHRVRVDGYWLGKSEVTQGQWRVVMGSNPSNFNFCGDDCPVEQVSWEEAAMFLRRLTSRSEKAFRFPTEAEWEYAARGGGAGQKWGGTNSESELREYAWIDSNSGNQTHRVCTKRANPLGLCDMSGNVREWVGDWFGNYPSGMVSNPTGTTSGAGRVSRGGCWNAGPGRARVAYRDGGNPANRIGLLGFRPALPAGR